MEKFEGLFTISDNATEERYDLSKFMPFKGDRGHIHRAHVGYVNGSETCRTDVKYHICGIDTFPARHNS